MPEELLVCRVCLACNVPVYDIRHTRYQDVLQRIAAISVAEHSKPHTLCAICLETLDKCCRLLEKSSVSEGILTRLLLQNQLTEDSIKSIDRQQHKLTDFLPSFTQLEPMRPNEVEKTEHAMDKVPCDTQKSRDPTNTVVVKTEPSPQIADLTDVMVKFGEAQSPEDPRLMGKIKSEEISEDLTDNVVVKTEPIENHGCFADVAEPSKSLSAEVPPKRTNHTISIETVKVKETPYIQIDVGKLSTTIKSEVNDDDEIDKSSNIQKSVDDESLVAIDIEMDQPIDTEYSHIPDDKKSLKEHIQRLYATSSKGVKDVKVRNFIEKFKIDGRKIKTVPNTESKTNAPDEVNQSQNPNNKSYHCTKCDYQTPFKKRLMYHFKKHAGFLICDVCDYKCATKSRLVCHLRVHTKERPYKCAECNKRFTELCSLTKHMNRHKGLKPYKCMWCEYEATSKNHLDRHIKRHIGDKSFKCELCDYACVQKWDLKRHAKTHENERANSYRSKRVAPVIVKAVSMAKENIKLEQSANSIHMVKPC